MRIAAVFAAAFFALSAFPSDSPLAGAKQLVVVVAPDWDSTTATMQRYERRGIRWRKAGSPVDVVIGRTGLAWGRGVNRESGPGPVKHEGDGKSPAGVFGIGPAFGFEAAPRWIRLPYLQLHDASECVDDSRSQVYNAIVERAPTTIPDWSSSEKMRSVDVYRWGAVVQHNNPPAEKGAGSCIFLHIVDPHGKPTTGCTSMAVEALTALLRWINPKARPLLVQLPRSEYERLRSAWELP